MCLLQSPLRTNNLATKSPLIVFTDPSNIQTIEMGTE